MSIIQSKHNSSSPESIKNRDCNEKNIKDLRQKIADKSQGGRSEMVKRHKERGKLLARERIEELIDSDIEISPLIINGKWCEIDTFKDFERAKKVVKNIDDR